MRYRKINGRVLGILGIGLPILAIICSLVHREPILPSISHYYHTAFQPIIIAFGCIMALTFFTLSASTIEERLLHIFLGLCAIIVAIIPTPLRQEILLQYPNTLIAVSSFFESGQLTKLGHFIFAALFFFVSSRLILVNFIKQENQKEIPSEFRITVFKHCGWGMCISIGIIGIVHLLFPGQLALAETNNIPITLSLETLALVFFSVAWIVRSNTRAQLHGVHELNT